MEQYELNKDKFVIRDYDKKAPFSSFLPGLAGVMGIPIWSFYTNRGQALCSFGVHNKGNAMMEFNSANTGYENTQIRGFRTFLRLDGKFCEPFFRTEEGVQRTMEIERNVVTIREERDGLRMTVSYFILPNESIGALVRKVTVENTTVSYKDLEMLDGMPQVIPFGIGNGQYKEMSNLFKSWADIKNIEAGAPVYTMRASSDDSAEVTEISGGYFYFAVENGELLPIVYDKTPIFGYEQSMMEPLPFVRGGMAAVEATEQCFYNKVPCAFASLKRRLAPREKVELAAFAGYTSSLNLLNEKAALCCAPGFAEKKLAEAREASNLLTRDVRTHSADHKMDEYVEQCYMDNFLRGGYPLVFGEGENKKVVHLFSRKHGDPERDYNFFSIAGEYFSQGNGNYRDVCQNRRLDCFLHPAIGDFNVRNFFSLVQMDGYNPLEIRPCTFTVDPAAAEKIIKNHVSGNIAPLMKVISQPFTPGKITNCIAEHGLTVTGNELNLVTEILEKADQHLEAGFGEGYWSDHWDYNLDLVADYLCVYPDRRKELLYGSKSYKYYDSVAVVRPRSETYVSNKGRVRQYGAIRHSQKKLAIPGFDPAKTNWLKDENGNVVRTNLFEKMLTLAVNKFALLDCQGLGIEMEGGKPGWNDAMNGLPGLLGSSMPETLELRRLVNFLREETFSHPSDLPLTIFAELADFMRAIRGVLDSEQDSYTYWDKVCTLREAFRERIEGGISGKTVTVSMGEAAIIMDAFSQKLEKAVETALEIGGGIMPTYFTYEADDFTELDHKTPYGLPAVKVNHLKRVDVPFFLEGPARYLASCTEKDLEKSSAMADKLRQTDVYDSKLKMYKTSASIEGESMEVGRVRAFTPGWLERESVFLHMEYKYFLGLLEAGLYDRFFEAIEPALIPHLDPASYGRSTLENSSFLASSANPDKTVHGRGFVGRLSGSTAEMLSMWKGMYLGRGGFEYADKALTFRFAPILKGSLFDENGEASFTLFGKTHVTYVNPAHLDTYKASVTEVIADGVSYAGSVLPGAAAAALRDGQIKEIKVVIA